MIYIFGHPPSTKPGEFSDINAAKLFLRQEIDTLNHFRYHYYHKILAVDRILFSFNGFLLGVFFVNQVVDPTPGDILFFAKTKGTYIITNSCSFCDQNHKAREFGIRNYQYGRSVGANTYDIIIRVCGGFCHTVTNPAFNAHVRP